MYTKNEFILNWHDELDREIYEDKLSKLYSNEDLNQMNSLINILDSLCGNEEFLNYAKNFEYELITKFKLDINQSKFFKSVINSNDLLDLIPIYLPNIKRDL